MPGQHAKLARMGRARSSPVLLQRFFLHHDDDILSLAMHPDKTTVATGQVRCWTVCIRSRLMHILN